MVPPSQQAASQAGKFKPKKPGKRIRVGSAVGAPEVPPAAAATTQRAVDGRGRGRERGGGRGRGGHGRGRSVQPPLPQGEAFFTALPAPVPSSSSARKTAASQNDATKQEATVSSNSSKLPEKKDSTKKEATDQAQALNEEIVGMLDVSIGADDAATAPAKVVSNPTTASAGSPTRQKTRTSSTDNATKSTRTTAAPDDYMYYDTDSSDAASGMDIDEMDETQDPVNSQKNVPLSLPFPRPVVLEESAAAAANNPASLDAPFSSSNNAEELLRTEKDDWLLLQLPTRLPPMQKAAPTTTGETPPPLADVATPPVRSDCFDNALAKAPPGRLGKLRVYKSGKLILVLQGPEGAETHLNVTQGLSAGFAQQLVAIDQDKGDFVPLGAVGKTLVAIPELSKAFADT